MSTKFQREQGFRDGAVVSLSGGLDSCVTLAMCIDRFGKENVRTVSFHYGQKHSLELTKAMKIAAHYGVPHDLIELPKIFAGAGSTLVDPDAPIQEMAS